MKLNPSTSSGQDIPSEVQGVAEVLTRGGFKAYLVGGCVRDILLGREPKDWDIATDAEPEGIQKLFPDSVYENDFGTVGVKTDSKDKSLRVVEVTTFRKEGRYTNKRHPDKITFARTIEEDLERRDFTVNAMALEFKVQSSKFKITSQNSKFDGCEIVDPYDGQKDLRGKLIRTVGDAGERFGEDALRLARAVRLAAELGFEVEEGTAAAVSDNAGLLEMIAKERVRDELIKIVQSEKCKVKSGQFQTGAARGVQMLEDLGLMRYVIPELREGIDCGQNKHHIYTVWEHNLRALDYAVSKGYSLVVRLAALLHDVGKPKTKRGEGVDSTFYGHEVVGAKMTARVMDRLKFSKEMTEKVTHLVRFHLFYYNVGEVSAAGVRRFLARVGPESVDDLVKVREADRIGSGVPKAVPYKLRHLLFMIEKVRRDPVSPKMLAADGGEVMKILGIEPGPKVGQILAILLEDVLDDPKKNTGRDLRLRIEDLGKLSDEELGRLAGSARERKEEFEGGVEEEMKGKYHVK